MKHWVGLFLLLFNSLAFAESFGLPFSVDEDIRHYRETIVPFMKENLEVGSFRTEDNINLSYAWLVNPRATDTIVIVPGLIESWTQDLEWMYSLYHQNYSVFIYDHRGQGLSDRELKDSLRIFVSSYDKYIKDFESIMSALVFPRLRKAPLLMGHSMGSGISLAYLLRHADEMKDANNINRFRAAALLVPLFRAKSGTAARVVGLQIPKLLLKMTDFALGRPSYDPLAEPYNKRLPFLVGGLVGGDEFELPAYEDQECTSSRNRLQIISETFEEYPQSKFAGLTNGWIFNIFKLEDELAANAGKLSIPIKIIESSEDTRVSNAAHAEFCFKKMPKGLCQLQTVEGGKHCLPNERDDLRNKALWGVKDFFSRH